MPNLTQDIADKLTLDDGRQKLQVSNSDEQRLLQDIYWILHDVITMLYLIRNPNETKANPMDFKRWGKNSAGLPQI